MYVIILFLTQFLAAITAAYDPSKRECSRNPLCLKSMRWCDGQDCTYPKDVYPVANYAGRAPGLVWGRNYELSWKQDNSKTPVTVEWRVSSEPEKDANGVTNTAGLVSAVWQQNVTDARSITLKPLPSLFKLNGTNDTAPESLVVGMAARMHNIRIRQIPPNGAPNAGPEDYSSFFFMLPYYSVDAIVTAAEAEKKVWKQNFALGTGLGVGLSLVFGVLGGWFLGARWAKRRDAKTSKS